MILIQYKTNRWNRYVSRVFSSVDKLNSWKEWLEENTATIIKHENISEFILDDFIVRYPEFIEIIKEQYNAKDEDVMDFLKNTANTEHERHVIKLINNYL